MHCHFIFFFLQPKTYATVHFIPNQTHLPHPHCHLSFYLSPTAFPQPNSSIQYLVFLLAESCYSLPYPCHPSFDYLFNSLPTPPTQPFSFFPAEHSPLHATFFPSTNRALHNTIFFSPLARAPTFSLPNQHPKSAIVRCMLCPCMHNHTRFLSIQTSSRCTVIQAFWRGKEEQWGGARCSR